VDSKLRVVTRLPLEELWDDSGVIAAHRARDLNADGVREALRTGTKAAVANIGDPLRWLHGLALFDWWKAEAAPRLLDPNAPAWRLELMPGHRGWLAAEWRLLDGALVLAFEAIH
jgi:hypothetical protein